VNNNNLGKSYAQVAKDFRVDRIELKERVTGKREVQIQVEKKPLLSMGEEQSLVFIRYIKKGILI